jgi:glucose-6-phosphate isomerase
MPLAIDFTNTTDEKVGKHGLTDAALNGLSSRLSTALAWLKDERAAGKMVFLDLPEQRQTIDACRQMAARFKGAENFLLAGIGGSALGPLAIVYALGNPRHNIASSLHRHDAPRFFVLDNVDPDTTHSLLHLCDSGDTVFNIVSKSGSTAETAAATLLILEKVRNELGPKWKERVVVTTDPASGDLRQLCRDEQLLTLDLHPAVGGRFSVLTPVGLFPSYCMGFDVEAMLAGAAHMRERCLAGTGSDNPAVRLAATLFLLDTMQQKSIHVMMAYANSLYFMADWFRQLWAESLGKATDLNGKTVNVGPTPVKALGTTDQHSQVQLYIEGPHDKVFLFLECQQFRHELKLPTVFEKYSSLGYLCGQSMNKLMAAEFAATREALARQGRPSLTISFPKLDAHAVGEFFMLLEIVTAISGHLYHINPFDQPGVELGKVLTYSLMGRKGFEGQAPGIAL